MGTARARIQRRQLRAMVIVACIAAPLFNLATVDVSVRSAMQGLLDGFLIALLAGGYLLFVRDGIARPWFQHLGFRTELALSSTIVLVLFLTGRAVGQVLLALDPARFLASFGEPHLIYAVPFFVAVAVSVQFILQMNRVIGTNVLGYFMAGVYRRPTLEERIFLFIDLAGSTQIAERLGSARYFELMRRVVDDLTEPVLLTHGEIYQYAGDEVVITWPLETGLHEANCLRCFYEFRAALRRNAAAYVRDFGVAPTFRGGLHGGTVTAGELGDIRRDIVFVGDILNTAARLEEYAKQKGFDLVVSGVVLSQLALLPGVEPQPCGELALRGKHAPVTAYGLSELSSRRTAVPDTIQQVAES